HFCVDPAALRQEDRGQRRWPGTQTAQVERGGPRLLPDVGMVLDVSADGNRDRCAHHPEILFAALSQGIEFHSLWRAGTGRRGTQRGRTPGIASWKIRALRQPSRTREQRLARGE